MSCGRGSRMSWLPSPAAFQFSNQPMRENIERRCLFAERLSRRCARLECAYLEAFGEWGWTDWDVSGAHRGQPFAEARHCFLVHPADLADGLRLVGFGGFHAVSCPRLPLGPPC